MSEIKEFPTTEVKVKVCTKCGMIVKQPHNEYNCPMSTSTKSWVGSDIDFSKEHPWWLVP